jgi:transcriptional regulator with XRE-family HTH domain
VGDPTSQEPIPIESLATKLRTSRQWISEVERGENLITVRTLYRLSRALNVSPETLLAIARV